ncbi:hypothetical protein SDC9_151266 [bioreactor metagenome]|uniref:Uncharacterized protein n=1 Tax=bioreactor metagenome TaxID=1076179 RepID=A0A645ERL3_9ZZZZ
MKAQRGRKAQRAQYAQGIFRKTLIGITDSLEQLFVAGSSAREGIDQPADGAVGHGVAGEIPPLQVFTDAARKIDAVGMPAVTVVSVAAEGGNLKGHAVQNKGQGTVLQPGFNDLLG